MKRLIYALVFVTPFVAAKEVVVTGYGSSYNSALENAKVAALEKGVGTFLIGESKLQDNKYDENIAQYNGGVIKTYDVSNHKMNEYGHEVTIVADVVPKDNTIRRSSSQIKPDFEEYEKRAKVVSKLNNVSKAIHAKVTSHAYKIGSSETTIYANVQLEWQPKWITDVKAFSDTLNDPGETTNGVYENVSGSIVNTLTTRLGVAGALVGMAVDSAVKPTRPELNDRMMVCFSKYSNASFDCSNFNVDMSFPRNPKLVVVGRVDGKNVVLFEQYLDMNMYRYVSAGESVQMEGFIRSNYKNKFYNPALLIYQNEIKKIDLTFNVKNSIIKSVSEVFVYLV